MNNSRKIKGIGVFVDYHALDKILQNQSPFYVEKYEGENSEPVFQGFLRFYEHTDNVDAIFIVEPTPIIENKESVKNEFIYQPKNTDNYYWLYELED